MVAAQQRMPADNPSNVRTETVVVKPTDESERVREEMRELKDVDVGELLMDFLTDSSDEAATSIERRRLMLKDAYWEDVGFVDTTLPFRSARRWEAHALDWLGDRGVPYSVNWASTPKELCMPRTYLLDEANEFSWPLCQFAASTIRTTRLMNACYASAFAAASILVGAVAALAVVSLRSRSSRSEGNAKRGRLSIVRAVVALPLCVLMDGIGTTVSACLPNYGTLGDAAFGPVGFLIVYAAVGNVRVALLFLLKELLPLTDVVPVATIAWFARFVFHLL